MGDRLRPGADVLARRLHDAGIGHVALVTGDRREIADEVARSAGIDTVYAEQAPEDKLDVVRTVRDEPGARNVVMVGDGVNDAPALALADVGIAMAGKGATISSETADVVITVDDASRIALVDRDRAAVAAHRAPERDLRSRPLGRRHVRGRLRLPAAGCRSAAAGGDRRRGDPQRAPRAAGHSGYFDVDSCT